METEIKFVEIVADLLLEGECLHCRRNGHKPNKDCTDHNAHRVQANEAAHTLRSLIITARSVRNQPVTSL